MEGTKIAQRYKNTFACGGPQWPMTRAVFAVNRFLIIRIRSTSPHLTLPGRLSGIPRRMDGHPRVFVKRRFVGPFCRFRWLSGSFTGYIAVILFTRLSRSALRVRDTSWLSRNLMSFSRTIRWGSVAGSRFSLFWIMNSGPILKAKASEAYRRWPISGPFIAGIMSCLRTDSSG